LGSRRASTLQSGVVPETDTEFRTRALYGRNNKAHEKTVYNEDGIPVSTTNATGSNYGAPAARRAAPAAAAALSVGSAPASGAGPLPTALLPPAPLATSFPLSGAAKPVPAVGWACTAGDAAAAVAAGVPLLDAQGDAAAESAVGSALAEARPFLVSTLPEGGAEALEAAQQRLGGSLDLAMLPPASWAAGHAASVAAAGVAVGLRCTGGPAEAVEAVNAVLAAGGSPAALQLPLDPTSPKVQRMLVGLCKRRGIRILAASPLGAGAGCARLKALVGTLPDVAEGVGAASVLLAWCVGRGIVALPSSSGGDVAPEVAVAELAPIAATARAALDAAAEYDGLRAAAVTE